MFERQIVSAKVSRSGDVTRRSFLQSVGVAGMATLGWQNWLLANSPALRKQNKSVIVLWMTGGPTQFETFDPKSGENGGEVKAIQTAVPGIEIAEYWPNVAKQMKDIAIIRSMNNREGNHQRATYQLHTGYVPSGSVRHPSFGSMVCNETAPSNIDLPAFVSIGGPSMGASFLPVAFNPFQVNDPSQLPSNTDPLVETARFERRLKLLGKLDKNYARSGGEKMVGDHQTLYGKASKMVLSPKLNAFDLSQEDARTREAYGDSRFGQGCLLARRLVESGVTYVEVNLGGWDMHNDLTNRIKTVSGQCDPAFAALVADLKKRRMLDDTLVVWMGEFGRTPKINVNGGRDHFPRVFNVAMAGGGVKGGQVIGKSSDNGTEVVDRPVGVTDLFYSFCKILDMQPERELMSSVGRPLKIVDGGKFIPELVG